MLTAYIPDSHMLTGSLSPAYWTLHPAWALACNLQKPTECKSSAPVCSECFCISLGKQVSFSGQCENEENMLQPLDYHCMFYLFSGNPCLCVALHRAPLSGSVENWKTEKQKPPIATAEPTPSSITSQRLIQLLLSCPIKLFIFSSAVPKNKRTHRLRQHKCNVGH